MISSDHIAYCWAFCFNFWTEYAIWLLKGFAHIIITDITAGQKIDALQKLGLAHYTCYMVTNKNTCLLKMDYFSPKNKILVNFMSDGLIHKIYINNFKLSPVNDVLCLHTTNFATLVIQIFFWGKSIRACLWKLHYTSPILCFMHTG